jgi:hypothetical protein
VRLLDELAPAALAAEQVEAIGSPRVTYVHYRVVRRAPAP